MAGSGRSGLTRAWWLGPELRHPLFVAAVLLYVLGKIWQMAWPHTAPLFVYGYLGDLLSMPVVLTLALWAQRRFGPHPPGFVFPDTWLLATWLYVSALFEGVMPLLSATYTADWLDVLVYGLSTLAFRQWLNRP
jgi:hypothetical protein